MQNVTFHPRPDFKRSSWIDFNGIWDFKFDQQDDFDLTINVPFVYQSEESGINQADIHHCVWYQRQWSLPDQGQSDRYILHFGAVDYQAWIWVNDIFIGTHLGGYTSFCFDITEALKRENTITVKVADDYHDTSQVRGKQMWQQQDHGCWYKGYTGIWQPVWLEVVNQVHLAEFRITPDIERKTIDVAVWLSEFTENVRLTVTIFYQQRLISEGSYRADSSRIVFSQSVQSRYANFNGIELWTPEQPNLYDIHFKLYLGDECYDSVWTYCGMRKIETRDNQILLNHIPCYLKMVLDQGYFVGGHISAKSDQDFIQDIELIKELGFNGVRKHQKIEDPRFLYWCDRLGLMVWEEMPSYYDFSEKAVAAYSQELMEVIRRDYNHPCIITWVTYNESWGIFDVVDHQQQQAAVYAAYYLVKALDSSRLVIGNDGWEHTVTDICTIHDYQQDPQQFDLIYRDQDRCVNGAPSTMYPRLIQAAGHHYQGQPVMLSEFAGIAFSGRAGWGYGTAVKDEHEYLERLHGLVQAITTKDYICGYCITQLTDVEHETNGLLYFDRTPKVPVEQLKKIMEQDRLNGE